MAEAHGNHKQREDKFSSCQVIQNFLLDCTVTAIRVNSASPHLGPISTEGFYSLPFLISLFPVQSVLTETSLVLTLQLEPRRTHNTGQFLLYMDYSLSSLSTQPGTSDTLMAGDERVAQCHCPNSVGEKQGRKNQIHWDSLWKSVQIPLLSCGYFIHFFAAAADGKPYSGSRVCFLLQPFQMTNSSPQPLPPSYKP